MRDRAFYSFFFFILKGAEKIERGLIITENISLPSHHLTISRLHIQTVKMGGRKNHDMKSLKSPSSPPQFKIGIFEGRFSKQY